MNLIHHTAQSSFWTFLSLNFILSGIEPRHYFINFVNLSAYIGGGIQLIDIPPNFNLL